jgi:uncharacterized protein (DUF1697 family)
MSTQVVLLRGINVGAANRIKMPALCEALIDAGIGSEPRTYVQSGNIALESALGEAELAQAVGAMLAARFSIVTPVVVREADELRKVVDGNPFPAEATLNPKALQVTFLAATPAPEMLSALQAQAVGAERVAALGRHLFSWHPQGMARSKMAIKLTPKGAAATARNWTTVLVLLEMAG